MSADPFDVEPIVFTAACAAVAVTGAVACLVMFARAAARAGWLRFLRLDRWS